LKKKNRTSKQLKKTWTWF